jgi:RNA polymerase sigma-70 factor (ECF subfamily)
MDQWAHRVGNEMPSLRRYARALLRSDVDADDLVQESVLRALSKRHLWQEDTDLRAWLFTIMHNQYVNNVRHSARHGQSVELDDIDDEKHHFPTQDKVLELRDLDRALGLLPKEQRAMVLLVGLEGMDYVTAAKIAGVQVGTVRSRLSRGREGLRRSMSVKPDSDTESRSAQVA